MPNNKMERFTERAQRALSLAQEYAERLQHNPIDTQHILMGLFLEEDGIAGRVLHDMGIEQRRLEALIVKLTPTTASAASGDLSKDSKRVLELAVDEARRLGHQFIGTEHLLLALVRPEAGVAIDILKQLGTNPEVFRRQTRWILLGGKVKTPAPSSLEKSRLLPRTLPPEAYRLMEKVIDKTLDMMEDGKLTQEQAVELFKTLSSSLKPEYAQLASLVSPWFDRPKYEGFKVQLTLSHANGVEIMKDSTMPFFTLLSAIDGFVAAMLKDPQNPLVFKLGSTSLEIKLECTDDNPNEAVL